MKKASTPSFVITLPLVAKGRDVAVMRKRFEAGRRLYNALLAEGLRRLSAMRRDPQWTGLREEKQLITRRAAYRALRVHYGFSEYALSAFGTQRQNPLLPPAHRRGASPGDLPVGERHGRPGYWPFDRRQFQ
jgi:hypothetical protein